jgi:hypothetical protein
MSHAAPPQRRSTDGRTVSTSVVVCALLLLVALAAGFVVLGVRGANSAAFGAFAAGAVPIASTVIVAAVKVDKVSSQLDGVSAQLGAGLGARVGDEVQNTLAGMSPETFGQLIGQAPLGTPSTSPAGVPPPAGGPETTPAPGVGSDAGVIQPGASEGG